MSRTFAKRLFDPFSFISSSFIRLVIKIVFRVMGLPGRCIRNTQGNHCRNKVRTLGDKNRKKLNNHVMNLSSASLNTWALCKLGEPVTLWYFNAFSYRFVTIKINKRHTFDQLLGASALDSCSKPIFAGPQWLIPVWSPAWKNPGRK